VVSRLLNFIFPWLTARTVIYHRHWSCLPAPRCAMHSWSGKRTKGFIRKIPSQSWKQTDLIARTTSIPRMIVVRIHPGAVRKMLTSLGVAETYTFLMNTWNTLPESYQQRVYHNTLATVKRQIQQAENPNPGVEISVEAARVSMLFFLIIWPPKWGLRSLRSEALTQSSRLTTIARMTNFISGCQGAGGIIKMKVMKAKCTMPSPPPAGDDVPQQNSKDLTSEPVISTDMMARMAMMQMGINRKKHHTLMMYQHRMGRTEAIGGDVDGSECEDGHDADPDAEE